MIRKGDVNIWSAGEKVYTAGGIAKEAFLVMEGSVEIFSADDLFLNRLGTEEIFGETSLMLDECRSVTAVAGAGGLTARVIPKNYINNMMKTDPVISAFLRKIQHRLIDSNAQSNELAAELDKVVGQLEKHFEAVNSNSSDKVDILARMLEVKRKVDRFKNSNNHLRSKLDELGDG